MEFACLTTTCRTAEPETNTCAAVPACAVVPALATMKESTHTIKPSGGHVTLVIDSAATSHYATSELALEGGKVAERVKIEVASGERLADPRVGSVKLQLVGGERLSLTSVLTHPKLSRNLMSVGSICDAGNTVTFDANECVVRSKKDGTVVMRAPREGSGLYTTQAKAVMPPDQAALATVAPSAEIQRLHYRMCHLSESGMQKLVAAGAVEELKGAKPKEIVLSGVCAGCVQGKAHRNPFADHRPERAKAVRVLERVSCDTYGPLPASLGGARYVFFLVDEYSRKAWVWPMKQKSDVAALIPEWILAACAQTGEKLAESHSDGALEYQTAELLEFFSRHGITNVTTTYGTPQWNAITERMQRTIAEKVVAALLHAGAPPTLWGEAFQAVTHVHNLTVLRTGMTDVPEALWKPHPTEKPSIGKLRVLFCDAWMLVPDAQREHKLCPKAELKLFVGYDKLTKAYRLMDVPSMRIYKSRDVQFDESAFTQCARLAAQQGGAGTLESFAADLEQACFDNEMRIWERISLEEHQAMEQRKKAIEEARPAQPGPAAVVAVEPRGAPVVGVDASPQTALESPTVAPAPRAAAAAAACPRSHLEIGALRAGGPASRILSRACRQRSRGEPRRSHRVRGCGGGGPRRRRVRAIESWSRHRRGAERRTTPAQPQTRAAGAGHGAVGGHRSSGSECSGVLHGSRGHRRSRPGACPSDGVRGALQSLRPRVGSSDEEGAGLHACPPRVGLGACAGGRQRWAASHRVQMGLRVEIRQERQCDPVQGPSGGARVRTARGGGLS